jgi:hypothetical protein
MRKRFKLERATLFAINPITLIPGFMVKTKAFRWAAYASILATTSIANYESKDTYIKKVKFNNEVVNLYQTNKMNSFLSVTPYTFFSKKSLFSIEENSYKIKSTSLLEIMSSCTFKNYEGVPVSIYPKTLFGNRDNLTDYCIDFFKENSDIFKN